MSQCDPNHPCEECKTRATALGEAVPVAPPPPEIIRQDSGPFRGRVYERTATGLKRRKDIEVKDRQELRAKQLEEIQRQLVHGRRGGKPRRQVEEMSTEEFRTELQAVRDEVTRNPRAEDFEPHPPGVTWPDGTIDTGKETTDDERPAATEEAVPAPVASEDQAG